MPRRSDDRTGAGRALVQGLERRSGGGRGGGSGAVAVRNAAPMTAIHSTHVGLSAHAKV